MGNVKSKRTLDISSTPKKEVAVKVSLVYPSITEVKSLELFTTRSVKTLPTELHQARSDEIDWCCR